MKTIMEECISSIINCLKNIEIIYVDASLTEMEHLITNDYAQEIS